MADGWGVVEIILRLFFVVLVSPRWWDLPSGLTSLWLVLVRAKFWVRFLDSDEGRLVAGGGISAVKFKVIIGADGMSWGVCYQQGKPTRGSVGIGVEAIDVAHPEPIGV